MRLVLLGMDHRTAPVEVRERLAFGGDAIETALGALRQQYAECEAVLLSTCNRTELYVARPAQRPPSIEDLRAFLAEQHAVPVETVTAHSLHREQEQAVRHLFRVCAGLESMVLGEPQILGQAKRAYEAANARGTVGPVLHKIFQQAVATAKRVRTESGIGEGRVSVASVAVDFARQIFEGFADKTVLGIGAGDMAKTTLRHLKAQSPRHLWIANRSLDRAAALAEDLEVAPPQGGARSWEDLDGLLVEADIVLTSTAAQEPILTAERFRPLIRKRRNRPLFIVDIAVPRDVEPAVGGLSNVYLYNIDDLQQVVAANFEGRRDQVERCEAEVAEAAAACLRQVQNRDLGQLVRQLRNQLHEIGELEQKRTHRKLAALGLSDQEAAVEKILNEHTHRVINKILHLPLSELHGKNADAPLGFYAAALRRLFRLEEDS